MFNCKHTSSSHTLTKPPLPRQPVFVPSLLATASAEQSRLPPISPPHCPYSVMNNTWQPMTNTPALSF